MLFISYIYTYIYRYIYIYLYIYHFLMDSGESFWELKSDFGAIFFRNLGTPQKKVAKIWDFEKPRTLQPPVFSQVAVPNGEMIKAQFWRPFLEIWTDFRICLHIESIIQSKKYQGDIEHMEKNNSTRICT